MIDHITNAEVHYTTSEVHKEGGVYALADIPLYRGDIAGGNGLCAHEQEDGSLVIEEVATRKDEDRLSMTSVTAIDIIPIGSWQIK